MWVHIEVMKEWRKSKSKPSTDSETIQPYLSPGTKAMFRCQTKMPNGSKIAVVDSVLTDAALVP